MMLRHRRIQSAVGGLVLAVLVLPATAAANDLMAVYRKAQQRDAQLQSAKAQRDVLLEQRPQARSQLLPQVSAQARYQWNHLHEFEAVTDPDTGVPITDTGAEDFDDRVYGLSLQQTLFDWQQFKALAQSDAVAAQAHAAYRAAEQDLIQRVADSYFTALLAEQTLQSDLDAHAAYAEQRDAAKKKFDVGLATITDVRNAQAAFDSAEAVLIADRRNLDSARRALAQIIGEPVASLAHLQHKIPLEAPIPASEAEWAKAALDNNPSLQSLQHASEAAQKGVQAAGGAYYPRVALVGSTARSDSDYSFGNDRLMNSIGVQTTWNLFQGGLSRSRVREAEADYERTQADLEGQKRLVDRLARDAFEGVISGIASVNATQQAVASTRTSLEASTIGLRVGARTQADVLDAQRDLAIALRNFYASRYEYLRNVLRLRQQAGSLKEQDLERIDQLLVVGAPSAPLPAPPAREFAPPPVAAATPAPNPTPTPTPPETPLLSNQPPSAVVAAPPPATSPIAPAQPRGPTVSGKSWRKEADGTLVLQFPAGRAGLSQEQIDWLTAEAAALRDRLARDANARVVLTGFADRAADGSEADALAARRAAASREVLAAASVPIPRMSVRSGSGSARKVEISVRTDTIPGSPN